MAVPAVENFLSDLKAAVMIGQPLEVRDPTTRAGKDRLTVGRIEWLATKEGTELSACRRRCRLFGKQDPPPVFLTHFL